MKTRIEVSGFGNATTKQGSELYLAPQLWGSFALFGDCLLDFGI